MNEILLISYFFPPVAGGGVKRALKLAKYLPEFGYVPVVIAADDPRYTDLDPEPLRELPPEVRVHRVRVRDPFALPVRLVKRATRESARGYSAPRNGGTREPLRTRVRRFGSFPDPFFAFYGAALKGFFRLPRRYNIRAIVSTAPPYTAHVVGARLKRIVGLPLVLDYRDAWTHNPFETPPTPFHRAGWRIMEQRVLSVASAVVTVTGSMADDYRKHFRINAPVYSIPNGYDEDDFAGVLPERRDKFTIVYAGKFYRGRDPLVFMEGITRALSRDAFGPGDIEIRFVGVVPEDVRAACVASGLPIVIRDHVPHREAIAEILSAHATLLIIGDQPAMETTLTGKIFEYVRAGRPIIAMVPPAGDAADLIRETDAGYVVKPSDVDGVALAAADIYRRFRSGELDRPKEPHPALAKFERRNVARAFAEVLDSLTGAPA